MILKSHKERGAAHTWIMAVVAVIVFVFFSASPRASAKSLTIDADQHYQFAEHNFNKGAYQKAIDEFERFVYFFPEDTRVGLARFQVAESYFRGHRFDEAIPAFQALINTSSDLDLSTKAYFRISTCHSKQKRYGNALDTLDHLLWTNPAPEIVDEIYYRKGWIFVEADAWEKARGAFDRIRPEGKRKYAMEGLLSDMDREKPPQKNPRTAGFLAILPGAGHLYCQRYQDAVISFVINGAMIVAAWEAFDNDNEALGGLLTLFEIGFYSANIYSAANCAHKYNRKQRNEFLQYLKRHATVKASTVGTMERPGLALNCSIRF